MSELPPLPAYLQPTSLIARSGVQFVDLGFDPTRLSIRDWGFRDARGGKGADDLIQLEYDVGRGEYESVIGGKRQRAEPDLIVGYKDALAPFLDRWVPVPYLRLMEGRANAFQPGPSDWARVRVVDLEAPSRQGPGFRDERGNQFRLALAFDTGVLPEQEGRAYLAPSFKDVEVGAQFALATRQSDMHWFVRQPWMRQWIEELFADTVLRRNPRATAEDVADAKDTPEAPTARYYAFLSLLAATGAMPTVKLVADAARPGRGAIDVDLVLDVGNSRTCGMLVESTGNGANFENVYSLNLRDLSHPERIYDRPFESRLEFAQAGFGKNHLSRQGGRTDAFVWPSMVRIGPEATRLSAQRRGTEGNTGMSSPKRYLWDEDLQPREWRYNAAFSQDSGPEPANSGPMARLINQKGEALHRLPEDDPDNLPVFDPVYSRSSLMTFAMAEILLQALMQMNSPAQRGRREFADLPRRLRRIVMTAPPGMPLAERVIFRERAEAARDLVWRTLDWGDDEAAAPKLHLDWDEASCTQLVYLYAEVARNWGGDARGFFDAARRPDAAPDRAGTLRIASIDVGGGTTDLIVNSYSVDGRGTSVTIRPRQEFREGFNKAGDDILLAVIQNHVLPRIEQALQAAGCSGAEGVTAELFGASRAGEDVRRQTLRRQFALQIAEPIGLAMLHACEQYKPLDGGDPPEDRPFAAFFEGRDPPADEVLRYVDDAARKAGAKDFRLKDVAFPVDPQAVDLTVRAEMQSVLTPLCELVRAYDCDMLLLSGRPSRLPAIKNLVLAMLPLPPHRVIALDDYRAGHWYPFRDAQARIEDPKTTVAVGAMLAVRALAQLPGFAFRSDELKARSTARYIGKIEGAGRILKDDVFFRDVNLDSEEWAPPETPFEFRGPMMLGARQLDLERWPVTQLFSLEYANDRAASDLSVRTPLKVKLRRKRDRRLQGRASEGQRNVETFEPTGVVDAEDRGVPPGSLRLRLQTLRNRDGYWLDTGMLKAI